jgi:hypothetical protein
MIRIGQRVGRNTYVSTGPVLGIFTLLMVGIFAAGVIVVLLPTLLVIGVLIGLGAWIAEAKPRLAEAFQVIFGFLFLTGIWIAINVAIIQVSPTFGGWLVVGIINIPVVLFGTLMVIGLVLDALGYDSKKNGPAKPPLSESEKIRQTRGWS